MSEPRITLPNHTFTHLHPLPLRRLNHSCRGSLDQSSRRNLCQTMYLRLDREGYTSTALPVLERHSQWTYFTTLSQRPISVGSISTHSCYTSTTSHTHSENQPYPHHIHHLSHHTSTLLPSLPIPSAKIGSSALTSSKSLILPTL